MTKLYFHNTLTRKKEQFQPIDPKNIRVYVCGPTVYDYAHIGNARPVIVFDTLFRLLRAVYGENHVLYVRNITDIDDKINARAARDYPNFPLNDAIRRLTEQTEKQFHADVAALNCLEPNKEPRATENIEKMKALIERLLSRGFAYIAENHILFSVPAMNKTAKENKKFFNPSYGRLSHRSSKELLAGARIDVESYKHNAQDFVLWKPSIAGEPGWSSPGGIKVLGRPGWHIECSAMSMAELLEPFDGGLLCDDPQKNCFDIHGGGLDLIFPHHENEIAQSCCAFNGQHMANYWLHNGFVQVEGQKMSKSLGNFTTIRQVLDSNLPQFTAEISPELKVKWAGLAMRFAMLQTHYRKPLDWTKDRLQASSAELYRWYFLLRSQAREIGLALKNINREWIAQIGKTQFKNGKPLLLRDIPKEVLADLADDLNTPQAIGRLRLFYKENRLRDLLLAMAFLGLIDLPFLQPDCSLFIRQSALSEKEIEAEIAKRAKAIAVKNWAEADKIRDALLAKGIKLQDSVDQQTGKRLVKWEIV